MTTTTVTYSPMIAATSMDSKKTVSQPSPVQDQPTSSTPSPESVEHNSDCSFKGPHFWAFYVFNLTFWGVAFLSRALYLHSAVWNRVLIHNYTFVAVPNLILVAMLPQRRRHWMLPFALSSQFQMLNHWLNMHIAGIDAFGWIQVLRLALNVPFLVYTGYLCWRFGPSMKQWSALPRHTVGVFTADKSSMVYFVFLPFAILSFYSCYFVFAWHWDYDNRELDAPIVHLQATNTVSVMLHLYVANSMFLNRSKRVGFMMTMFLFFTFQWIEWNEIFRNAPIPFGHVAVEGGFFTVFCVDALGMLFSSARTELKAHMSPPCSPV